MLLSPAFITILLLLMVATPFLARRVLLRPVFRAAEGRRKFARFTVTDIGALTAYFAIASGLTTLISDLLGEAIANYITVVSLCYVLGTWYLGVQSLDSAGITEGRRRLPYLGFAIPAAYAGSMTIVVITVLAVWFAFFESRRYMRPDAVLGEFGWIVWTVYGILWLSLILAWQIARWTAKGATAARATGTASTEAGVTSSRA